MLRALHPGLAPDFPEVSELFYARILEYPPARAVLERGESSVGRLKHTLVAWMDTLFQGPWDEAYLERRARIGRVHVRIGLPQHYMFGAMNVLRRELSARISGLVSPGSAEHHVAQDALSRMLDLELAIMLQTYREDLEAQKARSERLSTFGQVVASIGHELRNPLGVAESSVFLLEKRVGTDPSARKHLQRIGEQIAVANGIVGALLDLVRDRPMDAQPHSPARGGGERGGPGAPPEGVTVTMKPLDGIRGDGRRCPAPPGLRQPGPERRGCLRRERRGDGRRPGRRAARSRSRSRTRATALDATVRARLFEPLITTKSKGIGLGLALVRRIAERHGGTIVHVAPPTRGARFVLTLPGGRS